MRWLATILLAALRIGLAAQTIAPLPPMGWNSYDAYGDSVTEAEVVQNVLWLKERLYPLGWNTIVVDFRWYDRLADGKRAQDPEGICIDSNGRCVPATNRFPSGFKALAGQMHAMGLRFGIHIMRGIPRLAVAGNLPIDDSEFTAAQAVLPESDTNRTCAWNRDMFGVDAGCPAGRAWYDSIARQYASWGIDYIKCDDIANLQRGRIYDAAEIEALSTSLRKTGRPIILSISPGETPVNCAPHLKQFVNLWRISGDFWDRWECLDHSFDLFAAWLPDAGPGHWPDGDMIPLGHLSLRNCDVPQDRWTRFTRDEQRTLMTLLAIAPSPLMLGMNLPDNDDWTTQLLTNPEVIAVNQDALALPARRMTGPPVSAETWMKKLSDGGCAVALFNRSNEIAHVSFPWRHLGFPSAPETRDLWGRTNLAAAETYASDLPPHGSVFLRVK